MEYLRSMDLNPIKLELSIVFTKIKYFNFGQWFSLDCMLNPLFFSCYSMPFLTLKLLKYSDIWSWIFLWMQELVFILLCVFLFSLPCCKLGEVFFPQEEGLRWYACYWSWDLIFLISCIQHHLMIRKKIKHTNKGSPFLFLFLYVFVW